MILQATDLYIQTIVCNIIVIFPPPANDLWIPSDKKWDGECASIEAAQDFLIAPTVWLSPQGGGVAVANANVVLAVARGLRPPLISGAIANARSNVAQLVATKQLADRRTLISLTAANVLQSPNIDITA